MELKEIGTDGAYTHLVFTGKLDVAGVGEIENKVLGYTVARKKSTIIDLAGVTFMGSMALRLFVSVAKGLSRENKKLILLNPSPMADQILIASNLGAIMNIESDLETAIGKAKG